MWLWLWKLVNRIVGGAPRGDCLRSAQSSEKNRREARLPQVVSSPTLAFNEGWLC